MSWFLSKNDLSDVRSEIHLVRCNIISTGHCPGFKKIYIPMCASEGAWSWDRCPKKECRFPYKSYFWFEEQSIFESPTIVYDH